MSINGCPLRRDKALTADNKHDGSPAQDADRIQQYGFENKPNMFQATIAYNMHVNENVPTVEKPMLVNQHKTDLLNKQPMDR